MKQTTFLGGGSAYAAPTIEMLSISTERGFALSETPNYGDGGDPGGGVTDTDNGYY
ncbi:MAG: hypothetical protein RRY23_07840 [Alistipes sp.]